jgi:hypothetical protein
VKTLIRFTIVHRGRGLVVRRRSARAICDFIEREVLELPLQFDAVHIVDKTERLFLTFPLSRGQNGK